MKKKIVIVEDEFIIAEDLKLTVKSFGYDVMKVLGSPQEVYSLLNRERPDLILLDIKLAGKPSGIDVAKYVDRLYKIPIVFCSAFHDKATLDSIKDLQIKMVRKPFLDFVLKDAIDSAINQ